MVKKILSRLAINPSNSRQIFGLTVLKNHHKAIRRLRAEQGSPSHHGNKVWDSAIVLMDYLRSHPPQRGSNVLEVGCGWATSAIYCAKKWRCNTAGLDIDRGVLPFAKLHAEINGVSLTTYAKSYQRATSSFLLEFDLVIGSDICFWDELADPLFNLVRRAHKSGCRVVIADPGRSPFMVMAQRACGALGGELISHAEVVSHHTSAWILDVRP